MIRTFLAAAVSFAALTPLFASALSPAQPKLIRAPISSAVYYAMPDGRRFTFPNERIYRSWFNDFSIVEYVTDTQLASYRLAGAVVYHPGQLVKITTDPKVYVVTENGVLRWIETESTARRVAGSDWASLIHDLPDELFSSYSVGSPVRESDTQFSLAPLLAASQSIALNQRLLTEMNTQPEALSVTPTSTPVTVAPDILLRTSDRRGILPADTLNITVFGSGEIPENTRIYINSLLVQSCTQRPSCTYTLSHPTQSSVQSYTLRAEGVFSNGRIATQTLVVPVRDPEAGALRLLLSNTQGRINTPIDVRAEWKDFLVGAQRTQLIIDGLEQKVCFDTTTCTLSFPLAKAAGQTYTVVALVDDRSGKRWTSPTTTIEVVTNASPSVTAGINASTIYVGEVIEVNAQASDDDVITNMTIWRNDVQVATCARAHCTYRSELTTQAREETFSVTATDLHGNTTRYALDPIVVLPQIPS